MDEDEEAVELISGYDRWRQEQAQKEPDTSPRAYVAQKRVKDALERFRAAASVAAGQITYLSRVLEIEDLAPEEREAVRAVLAIAEIVQEAA